MPRVGEDIQVVLQTEKANNFSCEGFSGVPVVNPCLIALVTVGTPQAHLWAEQLRQELYFSILALGEQAVNTRVPCGGVIHGAEACHAHGVVDCQKLLILIGDVSTPFVNDPTYTMWSTRGSSYHVLPVLPAGADAATLLPSPINYINAAYWNTSIAEVIPKIFATIGLTAYDYRLFISYTRKDTEKLAEQLFDAASRENFDVYLDRFRMPPAIDFRVRIEQELGDKSMILLLESPNILLSKWCQHEIRYAKQHRLGLLALQIPGGVPIPGVYPPSRELLAPADFTLNHDQLTDSALNRVLTRIKMEHGKALLRRRQFIRDAMKIALRLNGVTNLLLGPDGLIRVQSKVGSSKKDYALWLTTRSPELADFQIADTSLAPSEKGVIIGPSVMETSRQDRITWLARKSNINCFDEGFILRVANDIAQGRIQ